MDKLLGLKIDVDTYAGMQKGVPALLRILAGRGVKGTFYLSIGPDASGRALFQLFRNPLFLKKMCRTNAVGLYGIKTALYGTLLPSPHIALSFPDIVSDIIAQGHEVQFHAWDHRRWQDELPRRSLSWIEEWFEKGAAGFQKLTGRMPASFGAPAWLIDDRVMDFLKGRGFDYLSCTRALEPFIHEDCRLLEIPSDLPCIEELDADRARGIIEGRLQGGGVHVLPLHAEVEGGIMQGYFEELLDRVMEMGYSAVPLEIVGKSLDIKTLPVRKYRIAMLPGRAAPCAV